VRHTPLGGGLALLAALTLVLAGCNRLGLDDDDSGLTGAERRATRAAATRPATAEEATPTRLPTSTARPTLNLPTPTRIPRTRTPAPGAAFPPPTEGPKLRVGGTRVEPGGDPGDNLDAWWAGRDAGFQ
jgi:hypothetical protein